MHQCEEHVWTLGFVQRLKSTKSVISRMPRILVIRMPWVADSQMIWSDCYAVLALAAQQTRKIKIGTGVSVAGTRLAPVTAHSIATINQLAPGRTFLGIGTGNTATRLMNHKPMKLKEFSDYLRVLRALLRGEEADFTWQGQTHPVQFLMQDHKFINVEDPIPLYVSGFGPKAQALAGEYGEGLVMSIPPDPGFMHRALNNAEAGAQRAGRALADDFYTSSLTTAVILQPGESLTSERVLRECGAFVIASLHYVYDKIRQFGGDPPGHFRHMWDAYSAQVEATPETHRHMAHPCWTLYLSAAGRSEVCYARVDQIHLFGWHARRDY